jgi:hypothetical protein
MSSSCGPSKAVCGKGSIKIVALPLVMCPRPSEWPISCIRVRRGKNAEFDEFEKYPTSSVSSKTSPLSGAIA